jgi:Na+-driven multidrug efflux pump
MNPVLHAPRPPPPPPPPPCAPSCARLCAEWWCFEISTLLAGALGVRQLGAQTLAMSMLNLIWMVPNGIATAAATRIGNLLGAGTLCVLRSLRLSFVWSASLASCALQNASR